MAISSAHPMFLLILSLFFLPASPARNSIHIENCVRFRGGIRVTGGEAFIEEGRKSFNVTFSTDTVLTEGVMLAVVKQNMFKQLGPILNIQRYRLCDLITCPISPGSFVMTFSKLYNASIKANIKTEIVLNGGPIKVVWDKRVGPRNVLANGSLCLEIIDYYYFH